MGEKLKATGGALLSLGGCLLSIAVFTAAWLLVALFIGGAAWVSDVVLPWAVIASILALAFLVVIVLPLSLFRRCRSFAASASFIISYVFGVTTWMFGLLTTLSLWGPVAVVVGLIFMGVGVVPIAMLAATFKGKWWALADLTAGIVLTFGVRWFAFWLLTKVAEAADESSSVDA